MASTIESVLQEKRVFPPAPAMVKQANISGMDAYRKLYAEFERDFEGAWARLARETLQWSKPFTKVLDQSKAPFFRWFYDGELNTGHYLNHGARNDAELLAAFRDQTQGKYVPGHDGPYPAGWLRVVPGSYKHYTQWSLHEDGTLTLVRDKGPVVPGIMSVRLSPDGHELEMAVPLRGFLVDERGRPIIGPGSVLDLSLSLEASGELAPGGAWASDTGEPIKGYVVSP